MSSTVRRVISITTGLTLSLATLAGAHPGCAAAASATEPDGLAARLAAAFRSDLADVQVTYDFWPEQDRVDGHAVLTLTMRPGQRRAIFHFNPDRDLAPPAERDLFTAVTIDGETLDPQDDSDVMIIRPLRSAEPAFEIQRDLAPGDEHTVKIDWSLPYDGPGKHPGWFYATFDDTEGPRDETETDWPTVSSPEVLVRHRITMRVHTDEPYTVIGSGTVEAVADDAAQTWLVDTQRAVSSSNVFFAAVPAHEVQTTRLDVRGVDVTIVSDQSAAVVSRAKSIITDTIGRLVDDLGVFPPPTMHVLLTGWHSGMEYYGATRTGIGSLRHELGHMYFGTSTVNRTWRDTWFDEAAVVWWNRRDRLQPLDAGYTSDLARDRSAVAPGFDLRAYGIGARVLQEVALALGGNDETVDFLADLHRRRAFEPFTTDDLIDDIVAAQDEIGRRQLEQWLYTADT